MASQYCVVLEEGISNEPDNVGARLHLSKSETNIIVVFFNIIVKCALSVKTCKNVQKNI